jgi:hypothetical protein
MKSHQISEETALPHLDPTGDDAKELAIAEAARNYAQQARAMPHCSRFTDDQLELIYAAGFARYSQGHFADAKQIFVFLMIYRPFDVRYLKALAAVQYMCGESIDALHSYSLLRLLAPDDVVIHDRYEKCQKIIGASLAATEIDGIPSIH